METWEHLALNLERRYYGTMDEPYSDWVVTLPNGQDVQGMQNILNGLSAQGYETVSIIPTSWGKTDVKTMLGIFKRKTR